MSPTVTECLESMPANASGMPPGPTMKRTANSFFGGRTNGLKRAQEKELETRASPRRPAA